MHKKTGFTLVELVVVVMILGILAAVATPRLLGTGATATENGLRQTLAVIRDAIERFEAQNGSPPANITTDLADFFRGGFPVCPVSLEDATVATSGDDPLVAEDPPTASWLYNTSTGEFICNDTGTMSGGGTYDSL